MKGYGIICDYAFPEENYPGKDGAAEYNGSQVRVPWKLTSDEKTVYGYYEKVNPGQHLKGNLKPTFVIDEAKTAANGGEHPVFRQAHVDEKAQYIWVSMSDSQDAGYKNHKATENVKFASGTTAAVMNSKYKVGDVSIRHVPVRFISIRHSGKIVLILEQRRCISMTIFFVTV